MTMTLLETMIFVRGVMAALDVQDKAGQPLGDHCGRVANSLPVDASDTEVFAAWLHDILEDTPVTAADLEKAGYDAETIRLVVVLTHKKGETYDAYLDRVIAAGPSAVRIKLADNADNADEVRLAALDERTATRLRKKYAEARVKLLAASQLQSVATTK